MLWFGNWCSCQTAFRMPQPQAKPRPRIQAKYHIDVVPSVEICGIAFDLLSGDGPFEHAEYESRIGKHDRQEDERGDQHHEQRQLAGGRVPDRRLADGMMSDGIRNG